MLWTATFGDPNALGAIYAPVEFTTYVSNSYAASGGGECHRRKYLWFRMLDTRLHRQYLHQQP